MASRLHSLRLFVSIAALILLLALTSSSSPSTTAEARTKKASKKSPPKAKSPPKVKSPSPAKSPPAPRPPPPFRCNMSDGQWVDDPFRNRYPTTFRCPFIPTEMNCLGAGRPDWFYTIKSWKTKQASCSLIPFNPTQFLVEMRNKVMAFGGDDYAVKALYTSIRCQMSLVTFTRDYVGLLWDKNITGFRVPFYNFTAFYMRAPFLTAAVPDIDEFDNLDDLWLVPQDWINAKFIRLVNKANIAIFSSGLWWNAEPINRVFYKAGKPLSANDPLSQFKIALDNFDRFFDNKAVFPNWKGTPYIMGYVPSHPSDVFPYPDTKCGYYTQPLSATEEFFVSQTPLIRPWAQALSDFGQRAKNVKFLDITRLTNFRADGHPGAYSTKGFAGDCINYCLPGVPDTWVDVFYTNFMRNKR